MIPASVASQIKKQLKRGTPEGELKNELLAQGYSKDDINALFAPTPIDMRSYLLVATILFGLATLYWQHFHLLCETILMAIAYYNASIAWKKRHHKFENAESGNEENT